MEQTVAFIDKLIRVPGPKAISGGTTWPDWALSMADRERYELPDYALTERQLGSMQAVSWVAQAVNAIASYVVASELHVRKTVGDQHEEVVAHPFELLLDNPNPDMSKAELMRATIGSKKLSGNAYWYLNAASETAIPDEIWLVPPDRIRPIPDGRSYLAGYEYQAGGKKQTLPPWQIVHFRNWHPRLPFAGLSDIEALAVTVEGDYKMNKWNLELFATDNAKFPGVLTFENNIPADQWQMIQNEFKDDNGGTRRRLRMLKGVGNGGIHWIQTLMTPKDIEFLAGRQFNREEIFGLMAPGLANMMAINATEANATAGRKTLMDMAVWPQLVEIAAKITARILPLYGQNLDCEFDDPRLPDRAMELAEQEAFAKVHTIDEVRTQFYQDKGLGDERGKLLPAEVTAGKAGQPQVVAQPVTQPVDTTPGQPEGVDTNEESTADTKAIETKRTDELATWARYAKKHGAQKALTFNCDDLPFGIETVVKARLSVAETTEEVSAAFAGPF